MSARHCVKYPEIQAFFDPYFPVYGQNRIRIFQYLDRIRDSVQMRENTDTILPTYKPVFWHILRSERIGVGWQKIKKQSGTIIKVCVNTEIKFLI